jgi:nucleotide-binding universal stress UspA family protein
MYVRKRQKIQKILVPLDGSNNSYRGLNYAINFAKQTKMKIIGLYVMPTHLLSAVWRSGDIKNEMLKLGKNIMKKSRQRAKQNNILFEERILSGVPGTNIIIFVSNKKNNVSLIIIGASSKGVSKEKYFGSVSNYVLNKTKIPVLIV